MKVTTIIHKDNRTREELRHAFRILVKQDGTVSRYLKYSDLKMNKLLDKLRFISKSRINTWKWCKFQFKMQYILGFRNTFPRPDIMHPSKNNMYEGLNFHYANETFWNTIKPKQFAQCNSVRELRNMMYNHYIRVIPVDDLIRKFVQRMINNFILFEIKRITGIYNDLGKTKSAIQEYVFPLFNELGIENWSNNLMGWIDRIDRATNDKLIYIDYKYGKTKPYHISYNKTHINLELGFYAILPQGKEVYYVVHENGKDRLEPLKDILPKPTPYYGSMLFFQDIQNTSFLFPITSRIITNTKRTIDNYWRNFNTGMYNEKPKDSCYEWCSYYWDICRYNPEWLDIKHCMRNTAFEQQKSTFVKYYDKEKEVAY